MTGRDSLYVVAGGHQAGVLSRRPSQPRGTSFVYGAEASPEAQTSLTMPVRPESWDLDHGLHPVFAMNLPEGLLRDWLVKLFAKAMRSGGEVDDFRLLQLTGHAQLGRLRFVADEGTPYSPTALENPPSMDWKELVSAYSAAGAEELFEHLLHTYALHSGLSGVQPKVLVPVAQTRERLFSGRPDRATFQDATHIVKAWREFPELATNEYLCLAAARKAGLPVCAATLSEDGRLLLVERFDLVAEHAGRMVADGGYLGFEDFCVLQGKQGTRKYSGSYEKAAETMGRFVAPARSASALAQFFDSLVFSIATRNGDAHLKNFGVLYARPTHDAVVPAPVYDVVTTVAYLPADQMALTLDGSKRWPDAKRLRNFGVTRCGLSPAQVRQALDRVATALHATIPEIQRHMRDRAGFKAVGGAMVAAWNEGAARLLG